MRYLTLVALLGVVQLGWAQKVVKPPRKLSPITMTTFKNERNYLKVTYGQPSKRGRHVFGALIPFGKIWRTGANEATEITLINDVKINKKRIKAGTYTIFTIPGKDYWTVIFNRELGQWGAFDYPKYKDKDALRYQAKVLSIDEVYEAFTIFFQERKKGVNLVMTWSNTMIIVPIDFV
ncbi:DUF2911 domain-containing protein [uncultured Microscilla sp.]|uniref:DUF2911 domain-containing protein n=1 Tax=uncultured Microscilla sp. TaxID=432653 RepID=UPI002627BF10|nr:DUF2911 domain-containing protein [uncultured Microscilla sp.]